MTRNVKRYVLNPERGNSVCIDGVIRTKDDVLVGNKWEKFTDSNPKYKKFPLLVPYDSIVDQKQQVLDLDIAKDQARADTEDKAFARIYEAKEKKAKEEDLRKREELRLKLERIASLKKEEPVKEPVKEPEFITLRQQCRRVKEPMEPKPVESTERLADHPLVDDKEDSTVALVEDSFEPAEQVLTKDEAIRVFSQIKGLGKRSSGKLYDAGINSLLKLANSKPDDLLDLLGGWFTKDKAASVISKAKTKIVVSSALSEDEV